MAEEFTFRLQIQGIDKAWSFDIPIRPEPIIIGRQAGNDLVLEHQQISRRHAALYCTLTECQITDLGSANGTRLNGEKLAPTVPAALKHGDHIQIGGFNLEFEQIPLNAPEESENTEAVEFVPMEEIVSISDEIEIPPPPDLPLATPAPRFDPSQPPPGLTFRSERLLSYLPGIYHTDFMANFLAIFESVLFPVEWQIDNFDLFLDPGTAPAGFLPWLENWFGFAFDSTWSEAQRRMFLKDAYEIYSMSGTRWALCRILEIYCGCAIDIDDEAEDLKPHPYTFRVSIPSNVLVDRKNLERLINLCKPAHTTYILESIE
jgi:phage tail-like protein